MKPPVTVKCPICRKAVAWSSEQVYRPFCSERCRLIDLGQWESERYAVPLNQPLDKKADEE